MLARVAALLPLVALGVRAASIGCPVFDSDMNLYVFGGASDYVLGAQDSWSAASAKTLSATGTRPPFDGANPPRCYLSQFNNAIYVLGADSKNPTGIYIYNAATKAWSLQAVDAAGIDPNDQVEILDHDTNVIYALSQGRMWFVNLDDQKDAKPEKLAYTDMGTKPAFDTTGYKATMGIASNHIHFFGTPGSKPGETSIFVIHFAYPQPELQAMRPVSGAPFPVSHGQSPALFQAGGPAQRQIAYVPDDMSATYIVDVKVNQTLPLAGPTDKSAGSIFTASINHVVQLTPSGKLFFLPVDQSDIAGKAANGGAAWKALATLPASSTTTPGTGGSGGNPQTGLPDSSSDGSPNPGNAQQGGSDDDDSADGDNAAGRMASLSALALLVPVVAVLLF